MACTDNSKWAGMVPKMTPVPAPLDPKVPDYRSFSARYALVPSDV